MLNVFTVSFFGHRYIDNSANIEKQLDKLIKSLITEKEYVEFLVGRDGDFDLLVASCISRAKKELFDSNSSLIWVQPYPTANYVKNQSAFDSYYDEIEVFDEVKAHPKAAFTLRNRYMLNRSNYAIFFVENNFGGAYNALKYAEKTNIKHINLANIS